MHQIFKLRQPLFDFIENSLNVKLPELNKTECRFGVWVFLLIKQLLQNHLRLRNVLIRKIKFKCGERHC